MNSDTRSDLAAIWKGTIHWDVTMAEYCTFRTGGKVDALLVAATKAELSKLMMWLGKNKIHWKVIGRGSNILVQSVGFDGVIIVLGEEFNFIKFIQGSQGEEQKRIMQVGTGCSVARFVDWCCKHELKGAEFLVGIPGSFGGAIRMNAGAWGSDIGAIVESICYVDQEGKLHEAGQADLQFSYRQLQLHEGNIDDMIILEAVISLEQGKEKEIIAQCLGYLENRRSRQPLGVASAGSFFKNPPGNSAGKLIEEAGMKGYRIGDAMVSSKHANFILNTGRATPEDIVALMKEVQQKVFDHSGIMLEPEVHII